MRSKPALFLVALVWVGCAGAVFLGETPATVMGATAPEESAPPRIRRGPVAARLVERGALLIESFEGAGPDPKVWRVWQSDPKTTTLQVREGRFWLTATGPVGHNGLAQLVSNKYKDVVLVGRMDVRSQGPDPHALCLHLCGGDGARSPDHWAELVMYDQGQRARFSYWAAVPRGAFRYDASSELVMDRRGNEGFLGRVELDAGANVCTLWVNDGGRWRQVGPPVELLLRTTHCEVKYRGGLPPRGPGVTTSRGWFDDVRIYPRPQTHPVGVRLVLRDGRQVWARAGGEAWPPQIRVGDGPERSIEELSVELWTADGKSLVSRVQSQNMGFYLMPLRDAPWDVYPVAARLRLTIDGRQLGDDVLIPLKGLDGLYPDDVWDVVVE